MLSSIKSLDLTLPSVCGRPGQPTDSWLIHSPVIPHQTETGLGLVGMASGKIVGFIDTQSCK